MPNQRQNNVTNSSSLSLSSMDYGKNKHVVEAVKSYCAFPYPQRHALMINGKWGSGKTHLLKQLENELTFTAPNGNVKKPIYITLYGVKDVSEIGEQLYQQLHPFLASKGARLVGAVMKGLVKTTIKVDFGEIRGADVSVGPQLPDVQLRELLNGADQRFIIFDDLERAVMSAVEVLGYINPLVEHDGCKAIILANEDEIREETYKTRKEKTVGQTLEVVPDVDAAFSDFLRQIDTVELGSFYKKFRNQIEAVFVDSGTGNLRLLKQFLWLFERYWAQLTKAQRANEPAMLEVMLVLLAYTLELRSNRIKEVYSDDQLIGSSISRIKGSTEANPYLEMIRRYPSVKLRGKLIFSKTIEQIILDSVFHKEDIRQALDSHPYFTTPDQLPSWRALWHGFEISEAELNRVLQKFEQDFEGRQFIDEDEILHVIGLSLWLSENGATGWSPDTVSERLRHYVDDVYDNKMSTADDVVARDRQGWGTGAFGLSFRSVEQQTFKDLASYLRSKVLDWRRRGLPAVINKLLLLMETDADAFLRDVCHTDSGPATYANLPVLSGVEPERFLNKFISMNNKDRDHILLALRMRYEGVNQAHTLACELPWLSNVHTKLMQYADTLSPVGRAFLTERIKTYLQTTVQALQSKASSD